MSVGCCELGFLKKGMASVHGSHGIDSPASSMSFSSRSPFAAAAVRAHVGTCEIQKPGAMQRKRAKSKPSSAAWAMACDRRTKGDAAKEGRKLLETFERVHEMMAI
jgi:hypothetical protein